ncbi:MAG TPA: fatty acid desaturase [Bacillota bacterium]|nr:fatty acid desaturase [Bacillota bacterium]
MSLDKQRELRKSVTPFAKSDLSASIRQLFNTIVPFIILWFLSYQALKVSLLLSISLSIIAAGFIIRIFIIFHDCTHYSFFKNNKANRIVGTITGVITLFPYEKWKRDHSIHHATSSNLDKRGVGDVWIMTVEEYIDAPLTKRLAYRMYRNPIVMFGLGPLYLFLVSNRLNRKGANRRERLNTYITNISILVIYSALIYVIGWQAFLIVQLPMLFVSGSLGIWLFYVQHQFEDSYFEDESKWNFVKAAVDGSSYYKLPKILQWITGNIGYHHVHHLSPRVPNYHLEAAHDLTPPLQHATTITLRTSLKSLRFRLYDESSKSFLTFRDVHEKMKEKKNISLPTKEKRVTE